MLQMDLGSLPTPAPPPVQWDWVTVSILVFAGFALGCMLMELLHRLATARKEKKWRAELQCATARKRPPASVVIARQREGTR